MLFNQKPPFHIVSESRWGFSLEHPQGVGIVGIVGTVGIVGIVGIEFCHPKPRPTSPSVLVDISSYPKLDQETWLVPNPIG